MKTCFLHPCHAFPKAIWGQKLSIQFSSKLELLVSNHGPRFWCIFKSQYHHRNQIGRIGTVFFFQNGKKKKKKEEGRETAIFVNFPTS